MNTIALQMLLGDRAKYLGLIFAVAFSTMLMSQQVSIFIGLMLRAASQIIDVRDSDIWVMDPRVVYVDEVESLTDTKLQQVRGVPGVAWAVPFFKGLTVARSTDGLLQQVILMGVDDASLAGAPPRMLMGNAEDLRRPNAMIMDRGGFYYTWPGQPLTLGKELELNDRRAVVVGICEASAPFNTFPVVYTKYSDALTYVGQQRKQLTFVLVRVTAGSDPSEVAERIAERTGLQALTSMQFVWRTISYYLQRTGIPVNFGITVLLGFIVGAAVVGQTFYIFVLENLKQFGVLKAMGVGNLTILRMVLLQALVVATLGYGIGIGGSALFFEITSHASITMRGFFLAWQVIVGTGAAVLAIIVLASLASIRKVLVVDPAIVFRE
jgi:putative ABC transport system permease protein